MDSPLASSNLSSAFSNTLTTLLNPQQWNVSPDRLRSPKPWLVPLILGTLITSTLFTRKTRILVFTPLLCFLLNELQSATGNNVAEDYGIAQILFGQYVLKFIDFGLLRADGAMSKLQGGSREAMGGAPKQERTVEKRLWRRVGDSFEFWVLTSRGTGWNWEVKGYVHSVSLTVLTAILQDAVTKPGRVFISYPASYLSLQHQISSSL